MRRLSIEPEHEGKRIREDNQGELRCNRYGPVEPQDDGGRARHAIKHATPLHSSSEFRAASRGTA
jgi:hypothetical protein